ncbi:MAG: thiol-disulfide isomerase/thioredoxin [Verrucomicrobiales bacterium]|jgi:thiol-disulfide isomerase/thioredoxin
MSPKFSFSLCLIFLTMLSTGQSQTKGIAGKNAPSWNIDSWYQLPKDTETLDVTDFRGKVLVVYCFQSWCPGCHSHGFPTLKKLVSKFDDDEKVEFVVIQTAFEGLETNSVEKLKPTAERYDLKIPFGHSATRRRDGRSVLESYRTGGTPWFIIIDPLGKVQHNGFSIDFDEAAEAIEELKNAKPDADAAIFGK